MYQEAIDKELQVHAITWNSQVNGPGNRHVVHTQGCTLACPGCFNIETHTSQGGQRYHPRELAQLLLSRAHDGITISGGEPFQQPDALLALLTHLRSLETELSVLIFSGYRLAEIEKQPLGPRILGEIDVLIDGRFEVKNLSTAGLRGSQNQALHLLSPRHKLQEFADRQTEIHIQKDGTITLTGFPTGRFISGLKRDL